MAHPGKNAKNQKLICLCNGISKDAIEQAIVRGCNTLGKIFDATTAGVGACGGSCQPQLKKMLDEYQATGKFPEIPFKASRRRKSSP